VVDCRSWVETSANRALALVESTASQGDLEFVHSVLTSSMIRYGLLQRETLAKLTG